MAGSGSISIVPRWLEVLLALKFFNACSIHELERRNEENVFCLDCCVGLCIHCMPSHRGHKILQIRRYVYQDVLCLKDANKLLDCSFVQSYTTNSAKVVFLHQRPLSSQFKGSNYNCILCHRSLQRPNIFCSISCKVQHMVSCSNVNLIIKYQKVTSKCESSMDFMDDQRTPNCQSMVTESVKTQHTSISKCIDLSIKIRWIMHAPSEGHASKVSLVLDLDFKERGIYRLEQFSSHDLALAIQLAKRVLKEWCMCTSNEIQK